MSDIPVFWIEPTDRSQRFLRRFVPSNVGNCPAKPGQYSFHDALVRIEDGRIITLPNGCYSNDCDTWSRIDPRWPKCCEACGYEFQPEDTWQLFHERIYLRPDTGEEVTLRRAPVGAIWRAEWHEPHIAGPDGMCIVCKTPAGEWMIDSVASNCDPGYVMVPRWTHRG